MSTYYCLCTPPLTNIMILIVITTTITFQTDQIKRKGSENVPSFNYNMAGVTTPILPCAGQSFKDKVTISISSMPRMKKIILATSDNETKLKSLSTDDPIEMMKIPVPGGRQAYYNITVAVTWNTKGYKKLRYDDKIIVFPAEIEVNRNLISLLLLEVVPGVSRQDMVSTVTNSDILKLLIMCDNTLLSLESNSIRRMFRDLSRSMEVTASELMGSSILDPNLNPSTMNLARIITDSYQFISQVVASELYNKFDSQTVKTIAWIDHDTRLALLVLTIISLKHGLFTDVTWEYIYSIEDIIVSWPNLPVSRK